MRRLAARLARRARSEAGTATVEFVILFPAFMMIMVSAIEASVLMSRMALLDRGLDLAVRELRLSTDAPPSFEAFRARVCAHAALLPDCMAGLQVELAPVGTTDWALLPPAARCAVDRGHYRTGAVHDLMMVRACLRAEPLVPNPALNALLPSDPSGAFHLVAISAFVQEPGRLGAGT